MLHKDMRIEIRQAEPCTPDTTLKKYSSYTYPVVLHLQVLYSSENKGRKLVAHSEVAQMRAQIELEYEAMKRGLVGVAAGVAKHRFIVAKMERVGQLTDRLAQQIGQEQANTIAAQTYIRIMEGTTDGAEHPSEAEEQVRESMSQSGEVFNCFQKCIQTYSF
jgi:hypothetical protein